MTKFDLEKLREIAQPSKEHRPRMTPDEIAEGKRKIREHFKRKRTEEDGATALLGNSKNF